jgi:RNA polymerase sigma factor (sigma-70 family)
MQVDNQALIDICRKLAHRYNRPAEYDDLVSEGTVKCLELRAENPDIHPAELHREANRAMHDYINLALQPVSIPRHNVARRLSHDIEDSETGNMSENGADWLRQVLSSSSVPHDEITSSVPDHALDYEKKDYERHVLKLIKEVLTPEELRIIRMRYWDDMTLRAVADAIGSDKSSIRFIEKRAIEKLCNNL